MTNFVNSIFFEIGNYFNELDSFSRVSFLPFQVFNNGDDSVPLHFQIYSSLISDLDRDELIFSKIKTLTSLFFGALRLTAHKDFFGNLPKYQNFRINHIYKDDVTLKLPDFAEIPICNLVDKALDTEYIEGSGYLVQDILNRCLKDMDLFCILLIASDRFDYSDLYKIREIMMKKLSRDLQKKYKRDFSRFCCSANNFTVTGFAARHAKGVVDLTQIDNTQENFMNLSESRELFRNVFSDYIKII